VALNVGWEVETTDEVVVAAGVLVVSGTVEDVDVVNGVDEVVVLVVLLLLWTEEVVEELLLLIVLELLEAVVDEEPPPPPDLSNTTMLAFSPLGTVTTQKAPPPAPIEELPVISLTMFTAGSILHGRPLQLPPSHSISTP
jgi:hypothetical protein